MLLGEGDLRLYFDLGGEGDSLCLRGEEYLLFVLTGEMESFRLEDREEFDKGECRFVLGGLGGLRALELLLRDEGGE